MGRKTEVIQIRLTVEEKLFIMEQAEKYDMTISDFVKYMVLPEKFEEVFAHVEEEIEELCKERAGAVNIPARDKL